MRFRVAIATCLGLASVTLFSGCADFSDAALASKAPDQCLSPNDCGPGLVCVGGRCQSTKAGGPKDIHVEVGPPAGSGFPRTQILEATLTSGTLNLDLDRPAEFGVQVLAGEQPISATLVAFGEDRIPNRTADVTRNIRGENPTTLRLRPGTYSVRLIPNNRELPAFEALGFTVRDSSVRQEKEFVVPPSYRVLTGNVESSVTGQVLSGVSVQAFSKTTGLPSTIDISDEQGEYELLLPGTSETSFLLIAELADPAGPSWRFEQTVKVEADTGREKVIDLEPTGSELQGRAEITVLSAGNIPEPILNASVVLTATSALGLDTRVYRISGVTNRSGLVTTTVGDDSVTELPLLAERYLYRVETPADSLYASAQGTLDLSATGPGVVLSEQIELSPRPRVRGTVVSSVGNPVGQALIELIPLETNGRPFDAETSDQGAFELPVDQGRYLMMIRPDGARNPMLPVHVTEIEVADSPQMELPIIQLPPGVIIAGRVTGLGAGPLSGARVEFFIHRQDHTLSIARTNTGSGGTYSVVLPDSGD